MNPNCHPFYKHSGKFGVHGPLLAVIAAVPCAYLLGLVYAYLITWIPFVYLNFLLTAGYSFAFGLLAAVLMKFGKVRNGPVALLTGLLVGVIAWYGNWNGYIHARFDGAPTFLLPSQLLAIMKVLLEKGSWGIGRVSPEPVTGSALACVWAIEGLIMIGVSSFMSCGSIAQTPFCETHHCWLDEEKKMDKLDAFTNPAHLAAFESGDIAPLEEAAPRVPASGRFARLTLKHSPRCDDFCAFSVANVTLTIDKDGKQVEEVNELVSNLWVPKSMFDYLAHFDHASAKVVTRS
jgi:hypothetical protein